MITALSTLFSTLLLAHGEPAGGAALDQVAIATGAAIGGIALIAWLGMGHRSGRVPYLGRAADFTERVSGLPGWAALPSALSAVSLLVALLGMYWDISLHIDVGRDPGPLANPAHYLILTGLFGIFAAGWFAVALPKERPGPAFPLDDMWHRLFGQDVTLWGPTHLMLIGGAAMTLVGQAVLLVEGMRARDARPPPTNGGRPSSTRRPEAPWLVGSRRVALMGALLVGLSTFQGEFDFGVPQFRFVFEPVLLAVAASVALVCARLWIGRGGALAAAGVFIAIRGTVALIVHQAFGEALPHFPIYLAEAACVELAGLALIRRPLALGAASGLLIGTVGFAAEWGWSQIAMPIAWSSDLLPEALILAVIAALAGGLVGALLGCALRGELPRTRIARAIPIVALVAIMGIFVDGLWTTVPDNLQAHVTLHNAKPAPHREVNATIRIDPPSGATDPAWLNATSWQGGGLVVDALASEGNGVYRTTEPIPAYGDWKTTIRLQRGHEVLGMPIYMPRDPEIPAPEIPAKQHFTRSFVADHQLLQREQKPGVPSWLTTLAPLVVLVLALGFLSLLAWGLGRIGRLADGEVPPPRPRAIRTAERMLNPA